MSSAQSLGELVQEDCPFPAVPGRVGRHDVLVEQSAFGTSLYRIHDGRVLTLRANTGYREDVAAALLDAVERLVDTDTGALGRSVRLRPIDVTGFPLDRAALLGPGATRVFRDRPRLAECGYEVFAVHRTETADGDDHKVFAATVTGKNLGIREHDWTRDPRPRAEVRRLDGQPGGLYRRTRTSRRSTKPAFLPAERVLAQDAPNLLDGVHVSMRDVRGHELELRREWDRLCGTLRAPVPVPESAQEVGDVQFSVPRNEGWRLLGPVFRGDALDLAPLSDAAAEPPETMLHMSVSDRERRRHDDAVHPENLDGCLRWLRALAPSAGNFLVLEARSGGVVQVMWHEGERLWLETPEPERRRWRGRHVALEEAERMITILAREDRVAVDELGDLETGAF
ncbi:hypothetical protein F4561_001693 [Lipingzhangella halophila]|uniref:Uncharacterized protein n=1 Tax=Lipingzhangella halophila TaxID=1783352 RepID=A0A7W7RF56_9ACTN|nr:hypothetical protein [Lipingzhangella halophila]MBB4930873.1 hypothetical protein [Lipingzhangella halophila]